METKLIIGDILSFTGLGHVLLSGVNSVMETFILLVSALYATGRVILIYQRILKNRIELRRMESEINKHQ